MKINQKQYRARVASVSPNGFKVNAHTMVLDTENNTKLRQLVGKFVRDFHTLFRNEENVSN